MTNEATIVIRYFDWIPDKVAIPTIFSEDFTVTGNKEVAKENFQAIMKKFPDWIEKREAWMDKYRSICKSLENNPDKDYLISLIKTYDDPNYWKFNTIGQDLAIGVSYSFTLIQATGEGFFCTGPYLIIKGYMLCEPKEIFKVKIKLECINEN